MQSHLEFVFEGEGARPLFNYWYHPFVKTGTSTRKPGEYEGHYIDYHGNYHIDAVSQVVKAQWRTHAFKITTRDPGIYYLKVCIPADGIDGVAEGTRGAIGLRVRVQDHPTTNMRCLEHGDDIKPQDVLKA